MGALVRKTQGPLSFRLNKLQAQLKSQAIQLEGSCESMAKEFIQGQLEHDKFIDKYVEARKETIMKQILADKFKEFIGQ